MHYYSHHIGDYIQDTAHLSFVEDSAYRKLLDKYYSDEAPIPNDEQSLFRLLRARSKDEQKAVRIVLKEFFTSTDAGWTHKRCDAEIAIFQAKSAKAASAAHKRWDTTSTANGMRTHSERTANAMPPQEPLSKTHNPETITQYPESSIQQNTRESAAIADAPTPKPKAKSAPAKIQKPEGVEQGVWDDWLQLRNRKGASVTSTVVSGAEKEAAKAGMSLNDFFAEWCLRGSQGLKAEWLVNTAKGQKPQGGTINGVGVSAVGMQNYEVMQRYLAKKAAQVVDMEGQ